MQAERSKAQEASGGTVCVLDVGALGTNQRMPGFIAGTPANAVCAKVMRTKAKVLGLLQRCGCVSETFV